MSIATSVVPVAEIFDLRWSVLRPGLPRATAAFPEDGAPGVFHVAAYPSGAAGHPPGAPGAPGGAPGPAPGPALDRPAGATAPDRPAGTAVPPGEPAAAVPPGEPAAAPGTPLACVTFFPDPLPAAAAEVAGDLAGAGVGYRFRGLASAPAARGQGYGAAVLRAGLAEAAARGAHWAWCNGRTGARDFYARQGFTAVGEEFDLPPAGRHLIFVIKL